MLMKIRNAKENGATFIGSITEAQKRYSGQNVCMVILDSDRKIVAVWVEEN